MGLGFVQRLEGNLADAGFDREPFGVATGAATHKERDLLELGLRIGRPVELSLRGLRMGELTGLRHGRHCCLDARVWQRAST